MHAYAGPACICRMHAPSMLIPPTQIAGPSGWSHRPIDIVDILVVKCPKLFLFPKNRD